jgi:hypothetical protein
MIDIPGRGFYSDSKYRLLSTWLKKKEVAKVPVEP